MPMVERMLERRWERRLLCADLVEIEWEDRGGSVRKTTAILEDISRSGACLQTDVPVPVEALVRVRHGRKTLEGTVSYCTYHEIGYYAGITFTAKQRWSRKVFRPKHLVDPTELEAVAEAKSTADSG
jgi:hypothetical protein